MVCVVTRLGWEGLLYFMQDSQNTTTKRMEASPLRTHAWQEAVLSRFVTGTGIALFGRVLGRFLFVLGQVIFARFLGPEEFGVYAIGWTLLQMLGTIAPLGLDKAVLRYATQYWKTNAADLKSVIFQSIGISLFSGACLGILLYLSAPLIAGQIFQNQEIAQVIRGLAPAFALLTVIQVISAATRVTQKTHHAVVLEDLLPSSASLLVFIPLFMLGFGLSAAIRSVVVGYLLSLFFGILTLRRLFPEIFARQPKTTSSLGKLMAFSLPSWLAGTFALFIIWINRLLIGVFRPESEVGIYQAVSQVTQLFPLLTSSIAYIFSPMIADLYHQNKENDLQELFVISTKWGLYMSLPLLLTTLLIPHGLLQLLFGNGYQTGGTALLILSLGQLINIASGFVGWMMLMTGRQVKWFWVTTITISISLGINVWLTPQFGLNGAAIATTVGLSMLSIVGLALVRSDLGFWPYDKRYYKILIASLISAGAAFVTRVLLPDDPFLLVALIFVIAIGAFYLVLLALGFDAEDLMAFRLIKSWLSGFFRKMRHAE